MSWINRSNVELLTTTGVPSVSSGLSYTVQSGDSWWSIAYKYGMSMYTLAYNNGKSIYSVIHPGDVLRVSGDYSVAATSHTYYTVRYGDSFWSIAYKYGISMYTLAANNGKSIYSLTTRAKSIHQVQKGPLLANAGGGLILCTKYAQNVVSYYYICVCFRPYSPFYCL